MRICLLKAAIIIYYNSDYYFNICHVGNELEVLFC